LRISEYLRIEILFEELVPGPYLSLSVFYLLRASDAIGKMPTAYIEQGLREPSHNGFLIPCQFVHSIIERGILVYR